MTAHIERCGLFCVVGRPAYIYLLSDPRTNEVRYVGKTCDPKRRFWDHIGTRFKTHSAKWVRSLLNDGVRPTLEVIEEFDDHDSRWEEAERFWICTLRFLGVNLTNQESGGSAGKTHSMEARIAISAKAKGRPVSQLAQIRSAEARRTPEFRAAASELRRGVPRSKEVMDRLHASNTGRKRTKEQKDRMRAAARRREAAKRGVDMPV